MKPTRLRWPDPVLGTDTLCLRPWRVDDAESLVAAWHDPAIVAMGSVPPTPDADYARTWIRGADQRCAIGAAIDLVIADRDDTVMGEVGATFAPSRADQAEIGYWVGAEHRGRGVASAAVRLFVDWLVAPSGLGLSRVAAQVDADNRASIWVLTQAGFTRRRSGVGGAEIYLRQGTENLRP